ncbi:uncharacterized protein LOC126670464 [Mercurialis annua]|uniref:uncharacterized protein LOC126670464 n=1 Tax=Mercurialis annua TaxID=3986 RepID=UPI00215EC65B|nr:uncharacterized protein LOC126670464 [Mercurialis annua]
MATIYIEMLLDVYSLMSIIIHKFILNGVKLPKGITYVNDEFGEERVAARLSNIRYAIRENDTYTINLLRMDRKTFWKLCEMVRDVGKLHGTRNLELEEMVAIFLYTISHHEKNRQLQSFFRRSGEAVSRQFNIVLGYILRLQDILFKKPEPILENSTDDRWKCFKNCLGALDGTYIKVRVPKGEKSIYRTRKNEIAMNVLGVCSQDMQFIYVLPGWEGSAHDGRILRNEITRRNGLRVPQGYYYLCDAGYTNCEDFLTPYRACCILHNLIRQEMSVDPMDALYVEEDHSPGIANPHANINYLLSSEEWNQFRETLAVQMFNNWRNNRNSN